MSSRKKTAPDPAHDPATPSAGPPPTPPAHRRAPRSAAAPPPAPAPVPVDPAPAAPAPAPSPTPPARSYIVYTIEDEATDAILYVGMTGRTVDRRMREHMIEALVDLDTDPQALAIRQLVYGPTGVPAVRPRVREIARYATRAEAEAAEDRYAEAFRAMGHPVTNQSHRRRATPRATPTPVPASAPAVRVLGGAPDSTAAPPPRQWRPLAEPVQGATAVHETPQRPARRWAWPPLAGWVSALVGLSAVLVLAVLAGPVLVPSAAASTGAPDSTAAASSDLGASDAVPTPTPASARRLTGQASLTVGADQSFADVAARLGRTPAELAAHLGRETVTAGETITIPLYDGETPPALERAPAEARVVATVVPTVVPVAVAANVVDALGCTACGGGPPPAPTQAPTYNDPAISSGGSVGTQEVGAVTPRYDDPAIRSGGSIGGGPHVGDPPPPTVLVLGTSNATDGLAHPMYDDPAIKSGGSIGGDGP